MIRSSRKTLIEFFARNRKAFLSVGPSSECARLVVSRFGGEVRGFQFACNRAAGVGIDHEFAITGDRFLVDPWLWRYRGERPVLDLTENIDFMEAVKRYGPEDNWFEQSEALLDRMLM
jgi:hypothetical protein